MHSVLYLGTHHSDGLSYVNIYTQTHMLHHAVLAPTCRSELHARSALKMEGPHKDVLGSLGLCPHISCTDIH